MNASKDSGVVRIEDCETMRMVSSYRSVRIVNCEPLRMSTASPHARMEDSETMRMASSDLHSRNENCENMRMVSSYAVGVVVGPICAEILAWLGTVDRALLEQIA